MYNNLMYFTLQIQYMYHVIHKINQTTWTLSLSPLINNKAYMLTM